MNDELRADWQDEIMKVGRKLYVRCNKCGGLVRVNKPIFGGLHICDPGPDSTPQPQGAE